MSLPRLDTPSYEVKVPSTEKTIRFRPFLVKEYKILLTALESDNTEIHRLVNELVDVCTFNKLDMNSLSNFDIEYIFLNIRAKSIGEISNVVMKCENCQTSIDVEMDVTKAEIFRNPEHSNKITITESMGLEMRYPKFEEMVNIYENFNSEKIVELICSCIKTVYTETDYYSDFTKDEVIDFVNSFSKAQFEKLEKFFLTMPKVRQTLRATCSNCSHHNETILEGLQNFFV